MLTLSKLCFDYSPYLSETSSMPCILPTPSFHSEIAGRKADRLGKPLFGASHGPYLDFMGNLAINVASFG